MTEMNTENNLEAMQRAHGPLLEVKNLQVDFTTDEGKAGACRAQLVLQRVSRASGWPSSANPVPANPLPPWPVLGLLPGTGHVVGGSIKLDGQEDLRLTSRRISTSSVVARWVLSRRIPMSSLNPVWRIGTQVKEALVANNMDIDHEKRSECAKALAGDEVELKGNDDETFLGSKELPDLIAAAKEALVKIGKSGDELDKIMARFAEEWVPGSETRWRVADGLIKAGVKDG